MAKFANVFGEGKREIKPGLKFSSGVAAAQRSHPLFLESDTC
jgi:hypothetical protein